MKNIFTEHPNSIGETYWQHFFFAFSFGFNMLVAGLACIVHAVFPSLFQRTGSNFLLNLTHNFIERMPTIEPRVKAISETIEKKAANH